MRSPVCVRTTRASRASRSCRLAGDEAHPLERRHLTRDTGGRDAEPLRELGAAELPAVGSPQLTQEREIGEGDAVHGEWMVELSSEHRPEHGEIEERLQTGHCSIRARVNESSTNRATSFTV